MKSDDPTTGWRDVREFYVEFAARHGWGFLEPMIGLVEWAGNQPFARRLYPGTSLYVLTVSMVPGYAPGTPLFSVECREDGTFQYSLSKSAGETKTTSVCPAGHSREVFAEFVRLLEAIPNNWKKTNPAPN